MRTSLTEIEQIEKYLDDKLEAPEHLVFEAKLLVNPLLKWNLFWQKKVYTLAAIYHRQKLKTEIQVVHHDLYKSDEEFRQALNLIFKK